MYGFLNNKQLNIEKVDKSKKNRKLSSIKVVTDCLAISNVKNSLLREVKN